MHTTLLYKKFLCVFMSLMIVIFSSTSALANTTSLGGWTALDTLTAGATNTINAVKGSGASAMRSAVAVAPQAAKVGGYLIRGGAVGVLAMAVSQTLGDGVDWVLDPANNAIKYTVPSTDAGVGTGADLDNYECYWGGYYQHISNPINAYKNSYDPVLVLTSPTSGSLMSGSTVLVSSCQRISSAPPYVPTAPIEKYIPIDTVAAQVVANAEAGDVPSQEAVKAVALEGFAAGEHDAALEAAAVPDTGVENPPDTTNPDAPAVPFDPSSILAALGGISAVLAGIMSSLTGFVNWWQAQWTTFSTAITDFNTWVRAEPDAAALEAEPVSVAEGTIVDGWQDKANAGYVNLGGGAQCPSDVLIPMSYMGASTNLAISYVPFCHFASIIRYAVIMGAWIAALMIISGGRTRE